MSGRFGIVLADPPWTYNDKGSNGAAASHYETMTLEDIMALPVSEIAAKDSVLFLWVTWPLLIEGLTVMEAWGFSYKSRAFTWVKHYEKSGKPFFGLGRWTRGNDEVCLLGVRGKPKVSSHAVSSLVQAPVGRHSAKPPEVRKRIKELMGDLPAVELFARESTEGWDTWGNEIESTVELKTSELIESQESSLSSAL